MMKVLRIAALAACTTIAGYGIAAGPSAVRPGDVQVAAGGIGEAEELALLAREKEFNLKLVFSLVEGNYLADVDLVVTDAGGTKLIERPSQGPLVLARLPVGQYGIAATRGGRTISRKVRVGDGRLRTEYFRWPADPAGDLPVSRWIERE